MDRFGIKGVGKACKDAACGISHALKVYEYGVNRDPLKFSNRLTDAGDRGVGGSLLVALLLSNRAVNNCNYTWGTCTLHIINLIFSVAVETITGQGRLKKRTYLQTLHTAYSLKNLYHSKVWRDMWLLATG